jgi:hypothetical protein
VPAKLARLRAQATRSESVDEILGFEPGAPAAPPRYAAE